ncbi:TolC family protein [Flaviaesturariibacter flavus]|uniref:TolC family protein n=1 Tax=Flaviaesturariibacter flavus TaxID=2502780 RepID=A0A4R1BQ04_9BACT|nr:TolC family protein [Flaviaesturariibacter flavus]TCJ19598.1 TolC family protein [Flaviaesturariibacter flavus]
MKNRLALIAGFLSLPFLTKAQAKWSLQECIDYAVRHNISVKEADLQKRLSQLTVDQSRASMWPAMNFASSAGYRFGLSENPTTGILQSSNFFNSGFSLSTSVTLFNWFSKRHQLNSAQAAARADDMAAQGAENDVALAVSASYLQVFLAKETISIVSADLQQRVVQNEAVAQKARMGVLSQLDVAQVRQQLLSDSLSLLAAQQTFEKATLQLKAVLALDVRFPLEPVPPTAETDPSIFLAQVLPDAVYAEAVNKLPQGRAIEFRIQAARERIRAAKSTLYPTFSLFGSAGSNFVNISSAQSFVYVPQQPTGAKVQVNGTNYDVVAPSYSAGTYGVTPFFRQLQKNFGQNIGISLSVPILNGKTAVISLKRDEISRQEIELQKDKFRQDVKVAVYTAYSEAVAANKKVGLSKRLLSEATFVSEAAEKKFNLNLLSTQDLLLARNALQKAKLDLSLAEHDLLFRIKLLEYYSKLP